MPHHPTSSAASPRALGLVALLLVCFLPFQHVYTSDTVEQLELAACLVDGGGFTCPGLGHWPPLLPLLTAMAHLVMPTPAAAARLVCAVAAALASVFIGVTTERIARSLWGEPASTWTGRLATLLCWTSPLVAFYGSMADNRALLLVGWAACLAGSASLWQHPSLRMAILTGAAAGLTSLARQEGKAALMLVLGGTVVRLVWPGEERRPRLKLVMAVVGGSASIVLVYLALMARVVGQATFDPRGWEMYLQGWIQFLPLPMVLDLFGIGYHDTELRLRVRDALVSGGLGMETSGGDRLRVFVGTWAAQLPLFLRELRVLFPGGVWAMAGLGLLATFRRIPLLCCVCLAFVSPLLLLPGLKQSLSVFVPAANFLFVVPTVAVFAGLGMGVLVQGLSGGRVYTGLARPTPAASTLMWGSVALLAVGGVAWASKRALDLDMRWTVFESSHEARAAAVWLKENAPPHSRVVTSHPGAAITWEAGLERIPLPSVWELPGAIARWQKGPPTFVVMVQTDLRDSTLSLEYLMLTHPEWCQPQWVLRGNGRDGVTICRVTPATAPPPSPSPSPG